MDRDDTLRKAEKLLRQGRLDAAIAEYARVAEDQPSDWTTAMVLGDLYARAGRIEQAVGQYARLADHLAREGFASKAAALYKKILKIHPDDDAALLRAAEMASLQGLTADAREYLQSAFRQRLQRADRSGAAKIAQARADLDPRDPMGRIDSARMLVELGDATGAAVQLRAAGEIWCSVGKATEGIEAWRQALRVSPDDTVTSGLLVEALLGLGDIDGAQEVAKSSADWRAVAAGLMRAGRDADAYRAFDLALLADPADIDARVHVARSALARHDGVKAREVLAPLATSADPAIQFVFAELEFRTGELARGQAVLQRCLATRDDLAGPCVDMAYSLGPDAPETGFAIIATVVQWAEAGGDTDLAIAAIERFLIAVPSDIAALEELVRVCGHSYYENQRYRAQVRLADVYLARERWPEARSLAEHLLAARPDDSRHAERLARALTGLGVPDVGAVVRASVRRVTVPEGLDDFAALLPPRLSTDEDGPTADSSVSLSDWGAIAAAAPTAVPVGPPGMPARGPAAPPAAPAQPSPRVGVGAVSADTGHAPDPGRSGPDAFEIDLSGDLDELLQPLAALPAPTEPALPPSAGPEGLDVYFSGLREQTGRDLERESAELAYEQASDHYNRDEIDAAVACLQAAARDPAYRFRAASMLARIARNRQSMEEAVEWLERAGESPAPTVEASHGLLYELGDALEATGEVARALAVFMELRSIVPDYRDVSARIAQLSLRLAEWSDPAKGPA
jgi:tetratricopeptide (TPR) repeat protein